MADEPRHHYLSVPCWHGLHSSCQGNEEYLLPDLTTCEFCDAPCICACHEAPTVEKPCTSRLATPEVVLTCMAKREGHRCAHYCADEDGWPYITWRTGDPNEILTFTGEAQA